MTVLVGPAALADEVGQAALVAARELFRQGTEDVDAGRFREALEKFRRVSAVRESPAVRFNIAKCEESLGKTGTALADFELAEREARQDPQHSADDVTKLARDHADALRSKVPRLALVAPSPAPPGMAVTLDTTKVGAATLGVPLPLDPGPHVIDVSAPGRTPFHTEVTLVDGESKTVTIVLPVSAPSSPIGRLDAAGTGAVPGPAPDDTTPSTGSSKRTWGWITIGAGGALGGASLAFLLLHNSAVNDIIAQCPTTHCPAGDAGTLGPLQTRAKLDEGLSIGFGAASAVALGLGVYLVLSAPKAQDQASPAALVVAGAPGAPAGLSLHATF